MFSYLNKLPCWPHTVAVELVEAIALAELF